MHLEKEMYWNDKYNKDEDVRHYGLFFVILTVEIIKKHLLFVLLYPKVLRIADMFTVVKM